ncbi:hypothetical protein ACFFMP_08085 [Pseudoroseomonas cervicalis]|uniref:hypothetical protein n=1 Tax=Teichococcus cervicalis TaxID=204525 RepID=UPI0035E6D518
MRFLPPAAGAELEPAGFRPDLPANGAAPAAQAAPLPAGEAQRLLGLLRDDARRAELLRTLEALAAAERAAPPGPGCRAGRRPAAAAGRPAAGQPAPPMAPRRPPMEPRRPPAEPLLAPTRWAGRS